MKRKFEIWCSCGDLMERNRFDKFQETYGDAYYCLGCDTTVYHKELKND